jgi:hypothetical protein
MLASIVLDRYDRTAVLDAYPIFGSLNKPIIKLMAFLRAMKYKCPPAVKEVQLIDISKAIGQMPCNNPNVFSFILHDYNPSGSVRNVSLVSPEAFRSNLRRR